MRVQLAGRQTALSEGWESTDARRAEPTPIPALSRVQVIASSVTPLSSIALHRTILGFWILCKGKKWEAPLKGEVCTFIYMK